MVGRVALIMLPNAKLCGDVETAKRQKLSVNSALLNLII